MDDHDRVTSIIFPFTGIEFVPDEYLIPASSRGTEVHKCIEAELSGWHSEIIPERCKPYIDSFREFWYKSEHIFKEGEIILEKRLYCDTWRITGQVDVIIKKDDRTYLIDWKTSSRVQPISWSKQGAAYRYLAEVNGYVDVDAVLFVKLDKNGKKPILYKYEEYEEDLAVFRSCLDLYRHFDMSKTRNKRRK